MKAIEYNEYGPPEVLHISEIEKPVPGDREVLVKIHATSVNYGDLIGRNIKNITSRDFHMPGLFLLLAKLDFGLRKPRRKILGSEFSGDIEAAGKEVSQFRKGDPVFGYLGQKMGAYAEYTSLPEEGVVAIKPADMSYEEAAVVPMGAIMALHMLREKGNIRPGQKVLILGASGAIGSAALQIAKHHFGASVTGVCGTPRLEFVKALGADKAIDYTKEDFTGSRETYDLIFDVLGKSSFSQCKRVLNPNGRYLLASFKLKHLLQMLWIRLAGGPQGKKVLCAVAPGSKKDLLAVKELIEAGKIRSLIDKKFPMEKAAEAHRYVEDGHKKGSIAITL